MADRSRRRPRRLATSVNEALHRRQPSARESAIPRFVGVATNNDSTETGTPAAGEETRWLIYREVSAIRFSRCDQEWQRLAIAIQRRVTALADWPTESCCPRGRLIEGWATAAHGPVMAAAGARRLALWREDKDHHGPRLDRALARYARCAPARPPGWPAAPIAGFARFLSTQVRRSEGSEHGMAYDVQRFNELTKQMSAYAHLTRAEHGARAAARARRRQQLQGLVEEAGLRFSFRTAQRPLLLIAAELLDSDHPPHRAAGQRLYAQSGARALDGPRSAAG